MTTPPVMTVTDELLADIQREFNRNAPCPHENYESLGAGSWIRCDDCGRTVDVDFLESAKDSAEKNNDLSVYLSDAFSELRRLRAENAELAHSLAESRANDQAAMGWLTSLRWASGDCGERMLPELVTHIEGLAKDSARLEWMVTEGAVIARMSGTGRPTCYQVSFPFEGCQQLDWFQSWREAVDAIMEAQ